MIALFVGAHSDDIELGAGGLVARLRANGTEVYFLILSDDPYHLQLRRDEAIAAAAALQVPEEHVIFVGFPDGDVPASGEAVGIIRTMVEEALPRQPDVVITHSSADSHNDHVAANQLSRGVFRRTILFFYSIHISCTTSQFAPRFFSRLDVANEPQKRVALSCHASQETRMAKASLDDFQAELGRSVGLESAEAFEIEFQVDADLDVLRNLLSFNDSPFHKLWVPLIGNEPLYLVYENFDGSYRVSEHESVGRDALREQFSRTWFPTSPVTERFSNSPDATTLFKSEHALLVGGPVTNPITQAFHNRLHGVEWVIDFELPNREEVFLLHKPTGLRRFATYEGKQLVRDLAVLTVMPNPYAPQKYTICCAGVHSQGTRGLLQFLAMPQSCPWLRDEIMSRTENGVFQVPLAVNVSDFSLAPLLAMA